MGKWDFSLIHAQAIHKPGIGQAGRRIRMEVSRREGDHHNLRHPASRFIVTIVHPQKDVPVGRAMDTVKKIRLEVK